MFELTNLNYILIIIEGSLFLKGFKREKAWLIIVATQLVLLLGLRGSTVGIDTQTYIDLFWAVKSGWGIGWLEIGNQIIYSITATIFNKPVWLLLIYATITVIPVLKVIEIDSRNAFFSIIIYTGLMYYYWAFNAMRQAAAMSIAFLAISNLERNKNIKYFVLTFFAATVHKSALVVLLFWIVKKTGIRANKNWSVWIIALSSMGLLFGEKVVSQGLILFQSYAGYIDSIFAGNGNVLNPILFLSIFLFIILTQSHLSENELFYLTMLGIGVILYFVSIKIQIVNRLTYYFTMPLIVLLPNCIESLKKQNKLISKGIFFVGISLYQFLLILKGAQGIVPYRFFWQ